MESSVDVSETAGSAQLCVNITHGNVESTASFRYSTSSGTATGMLGIYISPLLISSQNTLNSVHCTTCMHGLWQIAQMQLIIVMLTFPVCS